jgi:hypothetical protein
MGGILPVKKSVEFWTGRFIPELLLLFCMAGAYEYFYLSGIIKMFE